MRHGGWSAGSVPESDAPDVAAGRGLFSGPPNPLLSGSTSGANPSATLVAPAATRRRSSASSAIHGRELDDDSGTPHAPQAASAREPAPSPLPKPHSSWTRTGSCTT